MNFKSLNPATNEFLEEYELATQEDASRIIRGARKESLDWSKTDISERTSCLAKAADLFRAEKKELATHITKEMGKPIKESMAEVDKCALTLDYFAQNAEGMVSDELVDTEFSKSFIAFEPLGVIFAIMPWNFPYWQVIRFGAPALSIGNVIVLKHSRYVPRCSIELEKIFRNAGLPEFVFSSILADSKLAEQIIHSDIDAVTFTGSVKAGSRVAELAGKNLKKSVLELGGSDPFIVLDDADLELTTKCAVTSRTINAGQSCIAAKRFIVNKNVAEDFEKVFTGEMKKLHVGDPLNPETDIGPLVRGNQQTQMEEYVKDALSKQARLLTGGERIISKGFFFKPTILTNVNSSMRVLNEETFGPIAPIIRVNDNKEAVKEANNTNFGLGASIWSVDTEKAERLARQIQAGNIYINKIVSSDPRLPFGGIKRSGIGRELSRYGVIEFANIKTVLIS